MLSPGTTPAPLLLGWSCGHSTWEEAHRGGSTRLEETEANEDSAESDNDLYGPDPQRTID